MAYKGADRAGKTPILNELVDVIDRKARLWISVATTVGKLEDKPARLIVRGKSHTKRESPAEVRGPDPRLR